MSCQDMVPRSFGSCRFIHPANLHKSWQFVSYSFCRVRKLPRDNGTPAATPIAPVALTHLSTVENDGHSRQTLLYMLSLHDSGECPQRTGCTMPNAVETRVKTPEGLGHQRPRRPPPLRM